jgi:hypothetical protein
MGGGIRGRWACKLSLGSSTRRYLALLWVLGCRSGFGGRLMLRVVRCNAQVPVLELTVTQIFSGWQQVWPLDENWQGVSMR